MPKRRLLTELKGLRVLSRAKGAANGAVNSSLALVVSLAVTLSLAAALWTQEQQAPKAFRPPRVAVVDQNKVFDLYNKKQDRKEEFEAQVKSLDDKLKALEERHKEIVGEIPNLEPGKKRDEMELEKFKLEQQIRSLKEAELENLQKVELKYLQEIRDEISEEIQSYAKALDLDMVLEKEINANLGPRAGIRWPIVHYAKPEIEVTSEIAARLNSRYKTTRGAAVAPAPAKGNPGKGGSAK